MLLLDSKYCGILLQKEGYNFQVFLIGIFHFNSCYGSFSDAVIEKNTDCLGFLVFQVRKCQLRIENNQVLETHMLCIMLVIYCFILIYRGSPLIICRFQHPFEDDRHSGRLSYLPIRAILWVSSQCEQSHAGLPHYFPKSARFDKDWLFYTLQGHLQLPS